MEPHLRATVFPHLKCTPGNGHMGELQEEDMQDLMNGIRCCVNGFSSFPQAFSSPDTAGCMPGFKASHSNFALPYSASSIRSKHLHKVCATSS